MGTNDLNNDTDGDGILDSAEINQGLNPLDGIGFPTGIIGSVQLTGNARDIRVEGALDGSSGQFAYVATGTAGLAIVDASQFNLPILLSEIDLPGDNAEIAVSAGSARAFLAAGPAGLNIVDISDPEQPTLVDTISVGGGINDVAIAGGSLITAGREIVQRDPLNGTEVVRQNWTAC